MKFYYVGVTRTKEQVSGTLDAVDEIEAQMKLRAMQIRPVQLSETQAAAFFGSINYERLNEITIGPPIDLKGLVVFTRQFSSLIDSGIPVVQCLTILEEQERRPIFKKILAKIRSDVESGSGLAEALGRHPKAFSQLFVRIIEAGEISGTMDVALRRVGQQLEKLGRLRAKVISALTYPTITMVVAIVVLMFLLVKVIPEITKLYSQSSAELPQITQQVLALSNWFQTNYDFLVYGGFVLVVGFVMLYRVEGFRQVFDPLVLRVPLFGTLILKAETARFTRTLGTLIGTGVPLLNAFEICARLIDNRAIRESINRAASYVSEGKGIAAGLDAKKMFPPMVIHMVNTGEMTGRLDDLLGKVAEIYDEEVDETVGALTGLLQPAMIVVIGGIIAFLLMAMYLPIFQLAEKVTGGV